MKINVDFMYAIAFELKINELKKSYGETYNRAYDEVRQELEKLGFEWTQGSVYINTNAKNTSQAIKYLWGVFIYIATLIDKVAFSYR